MRRTHLKLFATPRDAANAFRDSRLVGERYVAELRIFTSESEATHFDYVSSRNDLHKFYGVELQSVEFCAHFPSDVVFMVQSRVRPR